ncbi:unnamed protein product [Phytophthora lilii]|uniref:Unnamed protein product n=1 Tax=Phytophthora lilii TaxID=2077276 RepID=A0A9W6TI66_9STRA|nr:unnamed protein product [Phytophthora lilii]
MLSCPADVFPLMASMQTAALTNLEACGQHVIAVCDSVTLKSSSTKGCSERSLKEQHSSSHTSRATLISGAILVARTPLEEGRHATLANEILRRGPRRPIMAGNSAPVVRRTRLGCGDAPQVSGTWWGDWDDIWGFVGSLRNEPSARQCHQGSVAGASMVARQPVIS